MSRSEPLRGCLYAGALLWINAYICRNWLFHPTAQMQTLDGAWSAVARLGEGWLHPSWWPFWDCGIPLEFASAPLVPALARALAGWRNVSHAMALQTVSALFYCAAPLALFLMAWLLTRAPGHAFFAGLFYSLLSPAQILAPEGRFSWAGLLDAHRLLLQSYRDQTPRAAALTFLLLFILFLARSFEKRRPADCTAAAVLLALAMLATPLAILPAALSACCLLAVLRPDSRRGNLCLTAAIVASALALAAPWLPPSLWLATAASSAASEPWTMGPFTALLAALTGWLALTHYLPRWTGDWRTQFFALFAWLMSCGPICAAWLQRQWLPRPDAFRIEMEPALALAAVFGTARLPRSVQVALAAGLLCLAGTQIVHHRRLAKDVQYPAEVRKTVESRASRRVAGELPGVRVLLPASMANWANAWTEIAQVSGSGGAATHNPAGRLASKAVYGDEGAPPEDARIALAWLKALGAGAVVLPSPGPLDAALEKLWREGEASAYRVPQRTRSLARVAPENALVRHSPAGAADTAELERFAAALDDPSLPEASFEWQGRNAIRIRAVTAPGQAISVQVSHHPGWHARVDGRPSAVRRDGLGLMWLRPDAPGAATVELHYDGGLELRLCRWLALATLLAGCVFLARGAVR